MATNSPVSPGTRERALRLACALVSNPNVIESASDEYLADKALRILNAVEKKLGLAPTRSRPGVRED